MIRRVLFVCSGNTCRSPMAATLLRQLWAKANPGWELEVTSAGTSTAAGLPATSHAVTTMKQRGLDLNTHRSQAVALDLLKRSDLVLTMTEHHKAQVRALWPGISDRLFTVGEYAGIKQDVPDPFGGPLTEYERTAATLERLLQAVAERIQREGAD